MLDSIGVGLRESSDLHLCIVDRKMSAFGVLHEGPDHFLQAIENIGCGDGVGDIAKSLLSDVGDFSYIEDGLGLPLIVCTDKHEQGLWMLLGFVVFHWFGGSSEAVLRRVVFVWGWGRNLECLIVKHGPFLKVGLEVVLCVAEALAADQIRQDNLLGVGSDFSIEASYHSVDGAPIDVKVR